MSSACLAHMLRAFSQLLVKEMTKFAAHRRTEGALFAEKLRRENVKLPKFGQAPVGQVVRLREAQELRNAQLEYGRIVEGLHSIPSMALRGHATEALKERGEALRAYLSRASSMYGGGMPRGHMPDSVAQAAARRKVM